MRLIALLTAALFSGSVFASKARVNSLQGANHLIDTQTVFTAPSHILSLNPYMTFEFGAAGAGAEGGIMRSLDNGGKLLAYLGHQNTTGYGATADLRTSSGFIGQNNPLEVIYGMGNMGYGASLSTVDNKGTGTKETTFALKWGMTSGEDWLYAHVYAISTASKIATGTDKDELIAAPFLKVGGSHVFNTTMRVYGELNYGAGKSKPFGTASTNVDDLGLTVGVEDRTLKTDVADIYYGISAIYGERKAGAKLSGYQLPAYLGIEYVATTWATVRASVAQNVLFGQSKATPVTGPAVENGIANNTTAAAGVGLKWNNLVLDGSLTAAGNGQINGNQFLSQASLTYTF